MAFLPRVLPSAWSGPLCPVWSLMGLPLALLAASLNPHLWSLALSAAASRHGGAALLPLLLFAHAVALLLNYAAARIVDVTGATVPQVWLHEFPRALRRLLPLLCAASIVALDIAALWASATALQLLAGLALKPALLLSALSGLAAIAAPPGKAQQLVSLCVSLLLLLLLSCALHCLSALPFLTPAAFIPHLVPLVAPTSILPSAESAWMGAAMLGACLLPHTFLLLAWQEKAGAEERKPEKQGAGARCTGGRRWRRWGELLLPQLLALVATVLLVLGAAAGAMRRGEDEEDETDAPSVLSLQDGHCLLVQLLTAKAAPGLFALVLLAAAHLLAPSTTLAAQLALSAFAFPPPPASSAPPSSPPPRHPSPYLAFAATRLASLLLTLLPALLLGDSSALTLIQSAPLALAPLLPLAAAPLIRLAASPHVMGPCRLPPALRLLACLACCALSALSLAPLASALPALLQGYAGEMEGMGLWEWLAGGAWAGEAGEEGGAGLAVALAPGAVWHGLAQVGAAVGGSVVVAAAVGALGWVMRVPLRSEGAGEGDEEGAGEGVLDEGMGEEEAVMGEGMEDWMYGGEEVVGEERDGDDVMWQQQWVEEEGEGGLRWREQVMCDEGEEGWEGTQQWAAESLAGADEQEGAGEEKMGSMGVGSGDMVGDACVGASQEAVRAGSAEQKGREQEGAEHSAEGEPVKGDAKSVVSLPDREEEKEEEQEEQKEQKEQGEEKEAKGKAHTAPGGAAADAPHASTEGDELGGAGECAEQEGLGGAVEGREAKLGVGGGLVGAGQAGEEEVEEEEKQMVAVRQRGEEVVGEEGSKGAGAGEQKGEMSAVGPLPDDPFHSATTPAKPSCKHPPEGKASLSTEPCDPESGPVPDCKGGKGFSGKCADLSAPSFLPALAPCSSSGAGHASRSGISACSSSTVCSSSCGMSGGGRSGSGSLSRVCGLGRGARRQVAAILDEFWAAIFDLHGHAVVVDGRGQGVGEGRAQGVLGAAGQGGTGRAAGGASQGGMGLPVDCMGAGMGAGMGMDAEMGMNQGAQSSALAGGMCVGVGGDTGGALLGGVGGAGQVWQVEGPSRSTPNLRGDLLGGLSLRAHTPSLLGDGGLAGQCHGLLGSGRMSPFQQQQQVYQQEHRVGALGFAVVEDGSVDESEVADAAASLAQLSQLQHEYAEFSSVGRAGTAMDGAAGGAGGGAGCGAGGIMGSAWEQQVDELVGTRPHRTAPLHLGLCDAASPAALTNGRVGSLQRTGSGGMWGYGSQAVRGAAAASSGGSGKWSTMHVAGIQSSMHGPAMPPQDLPDLAEQWLGATAVSKGGQTSNPGWQQMQQVQQAQQQEKQQGRQHELSIPLMGAATAAAAEEARVEAVRVCVQRLLRVEGSDWLFRFDTGPDEDLIAALALRDRKLAASSALSARISPPSLTHTATHHVHAHSGGGRDGEWVLPAGVWGCGAGCVWGPALVVSFGVWCVHRVLELSQLESRPELWGKYTYVLNHLQVSHLSSFPSAHPCIFFNLPVLCACFGEAAGQPALAAQRLFQGLLTCSLWGTQIPLASPNWPFPGPPGHRGPACAALFLDRIREVEAAVGGRKGRTGTVAGDVAFPKGKENLSSVLKRYKRRLGFFANP
ncbi:unnamed protein product [Closterium sp. NIES-65]|nr:unnamed protein product [Closterium sp. NIES-65]